MRLIGSALSLEALSKPEANTARVVITDADGKTHVVQLDLASIGADQAFVTVVASAGQSPAGCWVLVNGRLVWKDPCPV